MDIRQIRYFVAVAETLNFRRAAERLDMAQPPLSLAIRRLEEELQVRLFDRTNRSVKLTQAGVVFLEEARLTVKQLDHAVAVAQQAATSRPGSLRIGFPASSLFWLLPSLLRDFREAHPDIDMELREADSNQMIELVAADHIDMGFMRPILSVPDSLRVDLTLHNQLVAVLPSGNRLSKRQKLSLADLANEPFVSFAPSSQEASIYQRTIAACREAGFTPRVVHSVGHRVESVLGVVATGIGIAVVPGVLTAINLPGITFRKLQDKSPHLGLELIGIRRKAEESNGMATFLTFMNRNLPKAI